jgi:hypothetical protein
MCNGSRHHIEYFFQAGRSRPPQLQQIYPTNQQTKTFHGNCAMIITTNTTPSLAILFGIKEAHNMQLVAAEPLQMMLLCYVFLVRR